MNFNFKKRCFKNISLIVFMLIGLTFSKNTNAQELNGAFIMSSVGSIQNISNNSMAVTFSSNSNCFNIQNGTPVLIGERGTGLFANNCSVNTKFNTLGVKLFPNPVVVTTKVKFINMPPLTDQFSISIWNIEGYKMTSIKATGYDLYQGKLMDFSSLSIGSYIIQIESDNYLDVLKFVKVK